MQVVEVTGYAVRSAVITLRRRETPLRIVLFPMFHVASPAFFAQVRLRLAACDVIVAEGIRGRTREVSTLTAANRCAPKRSRNGLVEQDYATLLAPARRSSRWTRQRSRWPRTCGGCRG